MENDIVVEPMRQKKEHNPKSYLFVALIGLLFVGIVVFVVTTFVLPYNDTIVNVVDYNGINNTIPSDTKKDFSTQLFYQLKNNFEVPYRRGAVTAVIRPDTYKEEFGTVKTASFIIDIDEYQQTFQVILTWNYNGGFIPENVLLQCVRKELAKYPDAKCYAMYSTSDSISLYLPHEVTLSSGEKVVAQFDYTSSDGTQYIKILVDNCGNQDIKNAALQIVKDYINSLGGFNTDDYKYNIPSVYNNCIVR